VFFAVGLFVSSFLFSSCDSGLLLDLRFYPVFFDMHLFSVYVLNVCFVFIPCGAEGCPNCGCLFVLVNKVLASSLFL